MSPCGTAASSRATSRARATARAASTTDSVLQPGQAALAPLRLVETGGVRAGWRGLGVGAVDVLPQDPVEDALRRAVGPPDPQLIRQPRVRGRGRVALDQVDVGLDGGVR